MDSNSSHVYTHAMSLCNNINFVMAQKFNNEGCPPILITSSLQNDKLIINFAKTIGLLVSHDVQLDISELKLW